MALGSLEADTAMAAFSWEPRHGHPRRPREGLRCSGVPARLCADSSGTQAHANRKKSWGLGDKGSSLINSAVCLGGARLDASEAA